MGWVRSHILTLQVILLFSLPALAFSQQAAAAPTAAPTAAASAGDICPLLIGSPVPEVTVKTVAGESFDLNAAIGSKPTILIFYRGGW